MGGFWCFLAVLALVGCFVWQYIETKNALATTSVISLYDPQRTAEIIYGDFVGARSVLWADASGPGTINKRRRGKDGGITMSIDIEAFPGGGSQVDMWASQTNIYLAVFVNFAGVVNRRKKALARLLTAGAPSTTSRM